VVRGLYELLNTGDVESVGELVSPDYDEHNPLWAREAVARV
jgi:hypothetical protein